MSDEQIDEETDFQETIGRFILASPPGEENDVFHSLETIVGPSKDISGLKETYFHQLNSEQLFVATIPGTSEKCLIAPFGEIDETHYLDPKGSRLLTFDHVSQKVTETRELSEDELPPHDAIRKVMEKYVDGYVLAHFPQGVSAVYASNSPDGGEALVICINSTIVKPTSMWGGRFKSTWVVELKPGNATVNGQYEFFTHFFEAGNVHLHSQDTAELSIPHGDDNEAFCKAVVVKIMEHESKFQMSVDDSFLRLSETSFKQLRMQLPRSKTTINWETLQFQGKIQ
ncbi:putative F-actin-capping protein subunit alpha [Blattamonas nauphoetae]|uniref:F-actin-capping protein subunit alpha n=1 Tax=Blattamonas nauphoetae TaxID=2049346 RepID=A0ABQ9WWL2_9EUKA|nr:putative F-actin-capping protein subunit alpha [Blattamonas nauphoetae]